MDVYAIMKGVDSTDYRKILTISKVTKLREHRFRITVSRFREDARDLYHREG